MRWLVEVTSLGKDDRESLHVEAETWQKALQVARTQRGESGPMTGFSVELLDEGCRAVDPGSRLRYEVRRAVVTAPPPAAPAPAAAAAAPHAGPPRPASHVPSTLRRPGGQPAALAVGGGGAGGAAVAAVTATESPQPLRPEMVVNVPSQIVFKREHEASDTMPLTYREYVYVVHPGTTESAAEMLLQTQLELVQTSLDRVPAGKLVNLAVFDVAFQGKPPVPPLATLTWKDWRGPAVVGFPRRGAQPASPQAQRVAPAAPPPPQVFAQPAAPQPPVAPPQPFAPPVPQSPFGVPTSQPFAAPLPPAQPFAPAVPPPDLSALTPPPPAPIPTQPPPSVYPPPVAAPASVPPPAVAAPMAAAAAAFPGMAPAQMAVPAVAPAPATGLPAGTLLGMSAPAPPSVAPYAPLNQPVAPFAPPPVAAPAPVQYAPAPASVPPGSRVGGEDLIADLFESMHDLHFTRDAVEGGDFCLVTAMEKLPSQAALVHVFDISRREFLVANARGAGTETLLLRRSPEADPLLSLALRKRRAVVLAESDLGEAATVDRYAILGGARSLVVAPVMVAGRPLGAVELVNPLDGQPFTESDGNAVTYIAEQFAEFVSTRGIVTDPERISARRISEG